MKREMPPRFCSDCGHVLPESASFCPGCGVGIETTGSHTATPVKGKSSRNTIVGTILIVVGVIATALGYAFFQGARNIIYRGSLTGWVFERVTQGEAFAWEMIGIVGMLLGVVLIIVGLVRVTKHS